MKHTSVEMCADGRFIERYYWNLKDPVKNSDIYDYFRKEKAYANHCSKRCTASIAIAVLDVLLAVVSVVMRITIS